MNTLKKLLPILFALMAAASLCTAGALTAFAADASGASAAADAISTTPDVSAANLSGQTDAQDDSSTTGSQDAAASTSNDTASTSTSSIATSDDVRTAVASGSRVIDEDHMLTSSEISSLESMASSVESTYKVAPFYVTVTDLQGYTNAADFAEEYASAYGLDERRANGCVIFLICYNEGRYALVSLGECATTFSDSTLEYLDKDISPYLARSDWSGAGETFFDDIAQTLSGGTANATSNVAYNGTYVVDDYGLFSDTQRATLEAAATSLAEQYDMGVYLLVVDYMQDSSGHDLSDPTSAQRTNFATSFYRANDLGLGSGHDGIMLVIAVKSRDYVTIAYGQGSYSFSDEGIAAMEDAVTDELGSNNWYAGCEAYYDKIGSQLEYYSVKGQPWTEPDPLSALLKLLAILGIPAVAASGKVNREKAAMKTAREKTEASNYLVPNSLVLTQSTDEFAYTTHTVSPKPKVESDGGGGGGFSGGGGWGGGGGGGFSSSGGGKF